MAILIDYITQYHLGDIASVLGVIISVLGFFVTSVNVLRAKSAAVLAKQAAERARVSLRSYEITVEISAAVARLEGFRTSHRRNEWSDMLDRYPALRKTLIQIRDTGGFSDGQAALLQEVIVDLKQMESAVEKALPAPPPRVQARINSRLSSHVDNLTELLAQIRRNQTGV